MLKKLLSYKSLNYTIVDQAFVSGSNFLTTIILARLLGLEKFGIYSTLWLILLMINTVYVATIVFPMMSLVPKKNYNKSYFGHLLIQQFLFSNLAFIAVFAIGMLYFYYLKIEISLFIIFWFSMAVFFYHMQDYFRRYFFSLKKFSEAFIVDIITYGTRLIIFGIFLFIQSIEMDTVFLIYTITFVLGTIYGFVKYEYKINMKAFKSDFYEQWNMAKWLVLSGIMQWSSINLFLLFSSFILGPTALGAIRIGQNIISAFNVILQGIENFIPIDATQIYVRSGIKGLFKFIEKVSLWGLGCIMIFIFFIIFFAKDIIRILYGEEYVNYDYVVKWYAIILIFMFLLSIFRILLRTLEKTKIWFKAYLITSVFSVIAVYPFVKYFNVKGALFGILLSHIILIGSSFFMIKKELINGDR